jgi:hypothetical protein
MPVKVGAKGAWQTIRPETRWKTLRTSLPEEQFEVATDLFYVTDLKQ